MFVSDETGIQSSINDFICPRRTVGSTAERNKIKTQSTERYDKDDKRQKQNRVHTSSPSPGGKQRLCRGHKLALETDLNLSNNKKYILHTVPDIERKLQSFMFDVM